MANFTELVGGSVVNIRLGDNSGHVTQLILTEAEYEALDPAAMPPGAGYDPETLYFITEN